MSALESLVRSIGGYGSDERMVIFPVKPSVRKVSATAAPEAPPPTMTTWGEGAAWMVLSLVGGRRELLTSAYGQ